MQSFGNDGHDNVFFDAINATHYSLIEFCRSMKLKLTELQIGKEGRYDEITMQGIIPCVRINENYIYEG